MTKSMDSIEELNAVMATDAELLALGIDLPALKRELAIGFAKDPDVILLDEEFDRKDGALDDIRSQLGLPNGR